MAEAVVSSVSEAIANLLTLEVRKSLHGTRELVEELEAELSGMRLFLKDADARAVDDDRVRIWVSRVRDIAYDIEDLLERYVSEVGSRRNGGFVGAINRCVFYWTGWYFRRKARSEMQALKTEIRYLVTDLERYRIRVTTEEGDSSSSRQPLLPRTDSFVVVEDIVGLEEDVDLLVQRLVSGDEYRVVSICGMGGLGKTTLAREVYRHPNVRRYFDGFAWICVSKERQDRDILKGLITQLVPVPSPAVIESLREDDPAVIESLREDDPAPAVIESLREDDLFMEICTVLKQKRCLVVLDDIWRADTWECIRHVLPTEGKGSKILVTTRRIDLAFRMDSNVFQYENVFHYRKPLLSEDESWELFQRKALPETDVKGDMKMEMERVGEKMVRLCGGLPLAIVVLGGSLSGKSSLKEWESMYEKLLHFCSRDTRFDGELYFGFYL